jgi:5-methylcytosine-specific restriction endonuclease McrA
MNKRKRKDDALLKKNRLPAYERANGICELCKCARGTDVHHIIFRSHCGTSNLNNLALLCPACHRRAHSVEARKVREKLLEERSKDGTI